MSRDDYWEYANYGYTRCQTCNRLLPDNELDHESICEQCEYASDDGQRYAGDQLPETDGI